MKLPLSTLLGIFATALSQYVLAYASLYIQNFYPVWSAPLWPASGAALASTLLGGPWMLIGVYLGLLPSQLFFWGEIPRATSLLLPLANVGETALAWFLLRKVKKEFNVLLTTQKDLVAFLLLAPWLPSLLSAAVAQILLCASRRLPMEHLFHEGVVYAAGNASGIILLTPLILSWRDIFSLNWKSRTFMISFATALFVGTCIWIIHRDIQISQAVFILLVPVVVWGIWSTGLKGATLNCFILSFVFFNLKPNQPFDLRLLAKHTGTDSALYRSGSNQGHPTDSNFEKILEDPLTSQIALLTVLCITFFPLGLAADTLRASAAKDRLLMNSLESSLWTWDLAEGYHIDSSTIASELSALPKLFLETTPVGQIKVMPRELGASPYLSHWVTTHFSATGKPLQVTGILHSLGLQEKVEKAEKVAEIANVEMTTLRSRLNPHLLFNCLTGLRALISKDPQSAKEFTGKLANFLRSAVDTQTRSLILLEEELALCRDYLSLETMRGAKLKAVFRIDRAATRFRLPPMSVHTLLENAVKHGKRTKDKMMTISVIAKQTPQKKLILKVIQPGRLKKAGSQRSGAGLLLLRQQLDLLFQGNGQIRLIEDRPGFVTATLNIQMDETTS